MEHVVSWVMAHDIAESAALLDQNNASRLATGSLQGILNTAERERSSIFSAAADAVDAYTTRAGILTTKRLNFDAGQFIASHDTIYMSAPAEHQAAVAPIVCGLLAEIRRLHPGEGRPRALRWPARTRRPRTRDGTRSPAGTASMSSAAATSTTSVTGPTRLIAAAASSAADPGAMQAPSRTAISSSSVGCS